MIIGIGVDIVEIDRFAAWHAYSRKQLQRILSDQEIDYCLQHGAKRAERFAVRFAAREAFFKALSSVPNYGQASLLAICRKVAVVRDEKGVCTMKVDWQALNLAHLASAKVYLSMSHSRQQAIAFVVIER